MFIIKLSSSFILAWVLSVCCGQSPQGEASSGHHTQSPQPSLPAGHCSAPPAYCWCRTGCCSPLHPPSEHDHRGAGGGDWVTCDHHELMMMMISLCDWSRSWPQWWRWWTWLRTQRQWSQSSCSPSVSLSGSTSPWMLQQRHFINWSFELKLQSPVRKFGSYLQSIFTELHIPSVKQVE